DGYDADGDGEPAGVDCDDTDPALYTADGDLDGSSPCDGDCDDDDSSLNAEDADSDGFTTCDGDCDDSAPLVNPSAIEICDELDNDCDGFQEVAEVDVDGDGDPACSDCDDGDADIQSLDADGDGVSLCAGDCDDLDSTRSPAHHDDVGDALDANCDGVDGHDGDGDGDPLGLDCDDEDPSLYGSDVDGDGTSPCDGDCDDGDASLTVDDLDNDGFSTCEGDCDDASELASPDGTEVCDLLDNDCDGEQAPDEVDADGDGDPACSDCDDEDVAMHALDLDEDGFSVCGDDGLPGTADDDCDDNSVLFLPIGVDFVGDGLDTNCDGADGVDLDGDGVASLGSYGTDCDDTDPGAYPAATEVFDDGVDQDCDGIDGVDLDGDGYASIASAGTDCDDDNSSVYPGAVEVCDAVDSDCDTSLVDEFVDTDSDTEPDCTDPDDDDDGTADGADCAPLEGQMSPTATDHFGDGVDQNCDGADGVDADGDGWADLPSGGFDCDDQDSSRHPEQFDEPNNGFDDNCNGLDGPQQWTFSRSSTEEGESELGVSASVTGDCDLNGDGDADLVMADAGATTAEHGSGFVYVFLGPLEGSMQTDEADFVFFSDAMDFYLGREVVCVGDTDGDGFDDLLVETYDSSSSLADWLLFQGPITGDMPSSLADARIGSGGLMGDISVYGAADMNGDNVQDLLVGYNTSTTVNLGFLLGPIVGQLDPEVDAAGSVVGQSEDIEVGDFNGDGVPDLLVGVYQATDWIAHVFYGPMVGHLPGTGPDARLAKPDQATAEGWDGPINRVASLGDLDQDGYGDFLVANQSAGMAVFTGPLFGDFALAQAAYTPGSLIATSVLVATDDCDVDGNGTIDLLVNETDLDPTSGQRVVSFAPGPLLEDTPPLEQVWEHDASNGSLTSFHCAGDLDGEGGPDLVLADEESNQVYVALNPFFGHCDTDDVDGDGVTSCGPDGLPGTLDDDCNDGDATIHPLVPDTPHDGLDADCDGLDGEDADGDGWVAGTTPGTDCDDADATIFPGAPEVLNDGIDQDCNDTPAEDVDLDGFASVDSGGTDCDDSELSIHSAATDNCEDSVDQDCNGYDQRCPYAQAGDLDEQAGVLFDWSPSPEFGPNPSFGRSVATGELGGGAGADLVLAAPTAACSCDPAGYDHGSFAVHLDVQWNESLTFFDDPNIILHFGATESFLGWSVAVIEDVNGDDYDELLVGAPGNGEGPGEALLYLGPIDSTLDPDAPYARLQGTGAASVGTSVASAGDVNGDGTADLLIGAPGDGTAWDGAGAAYLVYSPVSGTHTLGSTAGIRLTGEGYGDGLGTTVAGVGDVNGDGRDDFALGAPGSDRGGLDSGSVYLFTQPLTADTSVAEADAIIHGQYYNEQIGWTIAALGSVDGDALSDFGVASDDGANAHALYLFYGAQTGVLSVAEAGGTITAGGSGVGGIGRGLTALGDLDVDGFDDFAVGVPGGVDTSIDPSDAGSVAIFF
ncbi:MAG TPA: hypothetical protein DIU15_11095, partial [Deltaproteobacteria bacterium]|nr:hypothetical protein [Deltaproteobacteria bacterium]